MKIEEINQVIDEKISNILSSVSEGKRKLAEVVLKQTKKNILGILNDTSEDGLTNKNLDEVCRRLNQQSLTYAEKVLSNVELGGLNELIEETRLSIKWEFLANRIKEIFEEGEEITPKKIQNRDEILYKALRLAIRLEFGETNWEKLKDKLPKELQERYNDVKISKNEAHEERARKIESETWEKIDEFDLNGIIAVLGRDPKKLSAYLELIGAGGDKKTIGRIVNVAFTGVRNNEERRFNKILDQCQPLLDDVEVEEYTKRTEETTVMIGIKVPKGTKELMVRGSWSRNIKINGEDYLELEIPLKAGKRNEIEILAHQYNERKPEKSGGRSTVKKISIDQIGEDKTVEIAEFLELLTAEEMEGLKSDKKKREYFIKFFEEVTIKKFAGDFEEGEAYMQKLKEETASSFVKKCIDNVLRKFRRINKKKYPFLKETDEDGNPIGLQFFQKYCAYKAEEMRKKGLRAVIIANEPGLGKTVTALTIINGSEPVIVCPNQAASTWKEEESKFFKEPFLVNVAGMGTAKSTKKVKQRNVPGFVTNIESIRQSDTDANKRKFEAFNEKRDEQRDRIVVVDEAHFLKNKSQQSMGYQNLESDFEVLLSASPWRNPAGVRGVMSKVLPDDERFKNADAFKLAFPSDDPEKIKALFVMMQDYVIRFLKEEVMPTFDPEKPLEEQNGLPRKKYIDPIETGIGSYTLSEDQEDSILTFFENWRQWNETFLEYLPKDNRAKEDGLWTSQSDDRLSKMHTLRYIMNHPKYSGSDQESPKLMEAKRILDMELSKGSKVLVFCRYKTQIKEYAQMLQEAGIKYATYYGDIGKDKDIDSRGYKLDKKGRRIKYRTDEYGAYTFNKSGEPVVAKKGEESRPMLGLDYERLIFQNNPDVKVCLSTYSAGSQSVTFTAADAIIKDGIPTEIIEEYQADDRIHRMDNKNKKYEVRYYTLVARYSDEFIEEMKEYEVDNEKNPNAQENAYEKWFKQGSYHEVQVKRLATQRTTFEILNNGIVNEPELKEEDIDFKFE